MIPNTSYNNTDPSATRAALNKLSPRCTNCNQPKLFMCIERCCQGGELLCLQCERQDHFLHRINQLELLFTAPKHKSYGDWLGQTLGSFIRLISDFRRESQELIKVHQAIVESSNFIIAEAERLRSDFVRNWHVDLVNSIAKHEQEDIESARLQFRKAVGLIDLYQKKDSNLTRTINKLVSSCKRPENQNLFYSLNSKINYLFVEPSCLLEDYFKQNSLQHFVDSQQTEVFHDVNTRKLRSIRTSTNYTYSSGQHYQRMIVQDVYNHNRIYHIHDKTVELHTSCNLVELPQGLRSLTFDTQANWQFIHRVDMTDFPEGLVVLRIGLFDKLAHDDNKLYNIAHLTSLKYLVVSDAALQPHHERQLIRFAIENNLWMLCLLNSVKLFPTNSRIKDIGHQLEAKYQHYFPQLKMHYLVRKRKLLQVMLLSRHRHLRGFFQEQLLEYSESQLDHHLQGEE